jgi:hypothetical protein
MKGIVPTLAVSIALAAAAPALVQSHEPNRARNEFRYEAGSGKQGRFERVSRTTWHQTDDNALDPHRWCVVCENDSYIELQSEAVPGMKSRIYERSVDRQNRGGDAWRTNFFTGRWVK